MTTMLDEFMRENWKEPSSEKTTAPTGIRVIKPGKSKEELERAERAPKVFKCLRCECVFEADKRVYTSRRCGPYNESEYVCDCPNCNAIAYEQGV